MEADGNLVVADLSLGAILRVDPVTGDRTIISDDATGSGVGFGSPDSIAVGADGDVVVTDVYLNAVFVVDPNSGDRSPIELCPPDNSDFFTRQDCNGDGLLDISDATFLLAFLFARGPPGSCDDACNANDDRTLDLSDPVYTLNYLFRGGPEPPPPFHDLGGDPTPDHMCCRLFPE